MIPVEMSGHDVVEGVVIEQNCVIGPFVRLRPGTKLEKKSLDELRKKYEKFYAVTDEKFDKKEFEEKIMIKNKKKYFFIYNRI